MSSDTITVKRAANGLRGTITVPGDKSISHRVAILGALSGGSMQVRNYLCSEDCMNTLRAMQQLGAEVTPGDAPQNFTLTGTGMQPTAPTKDIDCGNSGTGMRLMAGVMAALPFNSCMFGDPSLSSRPMKRIIDPLGQMGARITACGQKPGCAPLRIEGTRLSPIHYELPMASAQVKSAVLLAGMLTAVNYADMIVTMDADLQDDINAVDGMVAAYHEGYEVVYGVRSKRDTDTFFKRFTAEGFYKVMKALGVDIVFNHADYRLMSRRAVEGLAQFTEVNLFLRGIVPQIGYKWTTVTYERAERFAGESKYPLKKMLAFAADGITSFSVKPIRLVLTAGVVIFLVSLLMLLYALVSKILGYAHAGWTSLMGSIWLIGGIQLLGLGVVGEYIGKIYNETKRRPRFIIERVLNKEN